jgi:very-short-patch-repair endonuclease
VLTNPLKLRENARFLRKNMTASEEYLWCNLRRKQLMNVQFYRQKPIGPYVVDFYAHAPKLVIEVDGSQHFEKSKEIYDEKRTRFLEKQGLKVLRFNNLEVLQEIDSVVEVILKTMEKRLL